MILLQHLDIWVLWQTILTYRGEVCGFPAGAVEILLDLGWHGGVVLRDGEVKQCILQGDRIRCDWLLLMKLLMNNANERLKVD